jgi:hypothetical protein
MGWFRSPCAKAQFLRELRVRYGFGPIVGLVLDPFEFRSHGKDWKNIEQLEAVVEFFVNFRPDPPAGGDTWGDPWAANAKPLDDDHAQYVKVNLGPVQGTAAYVPDPKKAPNVIKLDGEPDLGGVIVNPDPAHNPVPAGALAPPAGYPQLKSFLYDTLLLDEDDKKRRPSQLYRITAVDNGRAEKTVTLDPTDLPPKLDGKKSRWTINQRPIIVVIDPLGARQNDHGQPTVWQGKTAKVLGTDAKNAQWTVLDLEDLSQTQSLARVNLRFDTIYLADDDVNAHRPARTYRIMALGPQPQNFPGPPTSAEHARRISVEGVPVLPATGSRWHLPAGLSGAMPNLAYDLGTPVPGGAPNPAQRVARGFDHYDAVLFIVHGGQIRGSFRWSSFTSRDHGTWSGGSWWESLSSIRGNARYYFSSYRSGGDFKNYTLAVIDANPPPYGLDPKPPHAITGHAGRDTVQQARFYFGTPNLPNPNDDILQDHIRMDAKGEIRLHRGSINRGAPTALIPNGRAGTGSAGCLTSPAYVQMRTSLVRLFETEYRKFYGQVDQQVHKLIQHGATNQGSQDLYNGIVGNGLAQGDWDDKLVGILWLIRPDEPPLS